MRHVLGLLLAVALLAGCTGDEEPEALPTPPTEPPRTFGPEAPEPESAEVDPCLLDEDEVSEVAGLDLPLVGPSGGELFAICTYGDPEGGAAADIAIVDLARVSEESGEEVDGESYIAELVEGVGTGRAEELQGFGDGAGVVLSYEFGSQAWAYVDGTVYGAYASALGDDDEQAVDLLEAVLASVG
jgi:hypothetical protein